ncbi:unnamed protein product [Prunus armeniaca]
MRTVGFLEKIHPRVPVAPCGTRPLELSVADASADVNQLGLQPGQDLPLGLLGHVGPTTKSGYGPCAGAMSGCLWQPFPRAGLRAGDALSAQLFWVTKKSIIIGSIIEYKKVKSE